MPTAAIIGAPATPVRRRSTGCSPTPTSRSSLGLGLARGRAPSALDVRLNGRLPSFITNEEAPTSGADVVFLCLEHEEAAAIDPPTDAVVVDLSGGHRLVDPALYASWYGFDHPQPAAIRRWSYALPELWPPAGRLVANPGCYATAALLALAPLAGAIDAGGSSSTPSRACRAPGAR